MSVPVHRSRSTDDAERRAWTVLRVAAALCFIGHGAFGLIGKRDWVAFFAVGGIGAGPGWRLMPWIGALDIALGISILVSPRRAVLFYMATWALWTAALRPLSGLPVWEMVERAGNYGVPLALLVWTAGPGLPVEWFARWLAPLRRPSLATSRRSVNRVLAWTTGLLLLGHGALAIEQKTLLLRHAALLGVGSAGVSVQGWLEVVTGVACILWPARELLLGVFLWKLATETLFLLAGAPLWELVERGGSYGAPLALALLGGGAGSRVADWATRGAAPVESRAAP